MPLHRELAARRELLLRLVEQLGLRWWLTGERRRRAPDQAIDELGFPVAPGRRPRRKGVRLGESVQQVESRPIADSVGHEGNRGGIVYVATRRGVGQEQVMVH